MINENLYDKNGGLIFTNVGQIIHSTTLDTEEKVKAIYGGVRWQKIEGRFLLGQSSSHAINSIGGEETHKLTVEEMPEHNHNGHFIYAKEFTSTEDGTRVLPIVSQRQSWWYSNVECITIDAAGGGQPHNNMPPYKVVYIWERIK